MHWSRGYVADIGYTAHFYREMAPSHLAFSALITGRSPGRALKPKRFLELGCGQGFGIALLAAANPHVNFEGYDFNPEHVAHANRIIRNAELTNIEVVERSFEEEAARGGSCDVDVLGFHGVLSWVSPESRDAIVSIARQRLQPDGLLYVSYNCQPGWAPLAPIRHLMREVHRRNPGQSDKQLTMGLDLLGELRNAGVGYFAANTGAGPHLENMLKHDKSYLAHEYFGADWYIPPFAAVADLLDDAKLSYIGSATITENLDQYAVPQALRETIAGIQDATLRETIRDYAMNKRFRRDIFARGRTPLTHAEHRAVLAQLKFVAVRPRDDFSFKFGGPLGNELNGVEDYYRPLADLLAERPTTIEEIRALPAFQKENLGTLLDCLALLLHSHQIAAILPGPPIDATPAQRFNQWITERLKIGRVYHSIAAPVIGSGIGVNDFDLLALSAVFDGRGEDPVRVAEHALDIFKGLDRRPTEDGQPIDDDKKAINFLIKELQPILEKKLPLWRRLGVVYEHQFTSFLISFFRHFSRGRHWP
jgi:SAM-dependent methyltransferase